MKNLFTEGDTRVYRHRVEAADLAAFPDGLVHAVCSTFALARDMEWASRLFVLEMCDADEEGIGTHLSIDHKSPAFPGEEIIFTARIESQHNHALLCTLEASVGDRLIATGRTGQKILKRTRIEQLLKQP
jgi:fluoroacetyl-CoA thioesterase